MIELLSDPNAWVALLTLTALELVLGIDNIVFISILADKLPPEKRDFARRFGLFLAMFTRVALLFALAWLVKLTAPLFAVLGNEISGRDMILLAGGIFLIWKATSEIHEAINPEPESETPIVVHGMAGVLIQIMLLDVVFSLDSIITAVGMTDQLPIMVTAVIISVVLMMVFAKSIAEFVNLHPTVKMLALSFLVMVGTVLIADGLGHHVPKGYVYFAMAFSVAVEMLNLRAKSRKAV